jgi:methionyl-tRNA synthetase
VTSNFLRTLYEKDFIEQVTEQLYDAKLINFSEPFVIGTCPKCGNEEATGSM